MITQLEPESCKKQTIFSPDRVYRYTLWREWERDKPFVMFIGLNPSTADETKDDPTIRRCTGFAKKFDMGSLCMTNLFAFRATNPRVMKRSLNPVGEDNHHHLLKFASEAGLVIAGWGKHGSHMQQDLTTLGWMRDIGVTINCLARNKDGSPKHPLYIPNSANYFPL